MKHLIKTLIIAVLFCSCKDKSPSEIDNGKIKINKVCDDIMGHFQTGKVAEVSKLLKSNSSLIGDAAIDTLQKQILEQFDAGDFSKYGNSTSYELVEEFKVGDFASKRFYALKFDSFFMTFTFSLYKTIKGWEITGFKYSEDNSVLF